MEKTRLSSKGQITLPKAVRDARRWLPGTEFLVEDTPEGVLLRPTKTFPATRLEDVIGCLHYAGKPKSLTQMEAAITAEIKDRRDRGRY